MIGWAIMGGLAVAPPLKRASARDGAPNHAPVEGAAPPPRPERITELRDDFLRAELRRPWASDDPADAAANRGAAVSEALGGAPVASCMREVCRFAGADACGTDEALLKMARACGGNASGGCLRAACNELGVADCLAINDVLDIASACRADFGGACITEACRILGPVECGARPVVMTLIDACRGNFDARCLKAVCARSPSRCGSADELTLVARACGGEV
ncbi:MAG TPA: hypothetical protein VHH90_08630 [Polyangia bacterium]|nr:hypothetical protein [Polyangia bacterium]